MKIYEVIRHIRKEIPDLIQDGHNPHFDSKFASLEQVNRTVLPILDKFKVTLTQPLKTINEKHYVITTLTFEDEQIISEYPVIADRPGPQAFAAGVTYARRVSLNALLGLSEKDDDGNSASADPQAKKVNQVIQQAKAYITPAPQTPQSNPSNGQADPGMIVTERQLKRLFAIFNKRGWASGEVQRYVKLAFNKNSDKLLNQTEYNALIDAIEKYTFDQAVAIKNPPQMTPQPDLIQNDMAFDDIPF